MLAGLRAAVATMVPLLAFTSLHLPGASWASFGGFAVAIADRGGAYRARAAGLASVAVLAASAVVLGGLVAGHSWIAIVVTFALVFAASLVRAFGIAAGGTGSQVAVAFVISLAAPSSSRHEALARGVELLTGGAWALALSLVFWPVRPYRPLRRAAADAYRAVAAHADAVARLAAGTLEARDDETLIMRADLRRAVRDAIEGARDRVTTALRGAQGEARRGERLLVLIHGADLLFGTLISIAELVEHLPLDAPERAAVARSLERTAADARIIAASVEAEPASASVVARVGATAAAGAPDAGADRASLGAHLALLLERLDEYVVVGAATADAIERGTPLAPSPLLAALTVVEERPPMLDTLRASLTLDSLAMRHALRVAIVTTIAVATTAALALPRGYWVTLTALIILQPYAGATVIRGLQRVIGTVAGGLLTAAFVALVQDERAILVAVFLLAAVSVAYLRVNYLVYSIFLTPTFVLLAEVSAGDWHLAGIRVLNTLLGGVLGLLGAWLLWPSPEKSRFPELAAAAINAVRGHLELVADAWTRGEATPNVALFEARRAAALAVANAEASLERLTAESAGSARRLEPAATLLAIARRTVGAATALGTLRFTTDAPAARAAVSAFARRVVAALGALAGDVAAGRVPDALSLAVPSREEVGDPLARAQLERIARQVEILHGAVARFIGA